MAISHVDTLYDQGTAKSVFNFDLSTTSCAVNDFLIVCCAVEQSTYTYTFNIDNAGWQHGWVISNQIGSRNHRINVWYNIIDGIAIKTTDTITLTQQAADDTVCYCVILRGVDLAYRIGPADNNEDTSTAGDPVATAKSGLETTDWVLFGGSCMYGTTYTPPTNWIELADNRSGTAANNISTALCYRTGVTSTAADTMDAANNDYWASWTTVIKQATTTPLTSDNFDDNSLDSSIWLGNYVYGDGSGTILEQNQRLEVSLTSGATIYDATGAWLGQVNIQDNFSVSVKITSFTVNNTSNSFAKAYLILANNSVTYDYFNYGYAVGIWEDDTGLFLDYYYDGTTWSDAIEITVPVWVKMVLFEGILTYYYSTNGTDWIILETRNITDMDLVRMVGTDSYIQTNVAADRTLDVYFDDFDVSYTKYQVASWGEQTFHAGYDQQPWLYWKKPTGVSVESDTISGSYYGYLNTYDTTNYSNVYDTQASGAQTFTLATDTWQNGQGNGTVYIRGDASSFLWDDVSPSWEEINSTAENKEWRYIQLKVVHAAA